MPMPTPIVYALMALMCEAALGPAVKQWRQSRDIPCFHLNDDNFVLLQRLCQENELKDLVAEAAEITVCVANQALFIAMLS